MLHLAHHADQLVDHRGLALQGTVYIVHSLHVENSYAFLDGKPPGPDHTPCGLIDEHHLVPHRIGAVQKLYAHIRICVYVCLNRLYGGLVFSLNADDGLPRPHSTGYAVKGPQDRFRLLLHELSVEL